MDDTLQYISLACQMSGPEFSPQRLQAHCAWPLQGKREVGGCNPRTGGVHTLGSADWILADTADFAQVQDFLRRLPNLHTLRSEFGVDECLLDMALYFRGVIICDLPVALMQALAATGLPLAISCYVVDEDKDEA